MLLLNLIPAPLHRALYRLAHAMRAKLWRVWRPTVHGVRILALDPQGRVLLVRHSYGSDKWMPPGGGMQQGEDPISTAARELLEETACRLTDGRLLGVPTEDLHGATNTVRVVLGRTLDEPRADGREIVEVGFFALNALPDNMTPHMAQSVREWLKPA